jgi:hypothetical protein
VPLLVTIGGDPCEIVGDATDTEVVCVMPVTASGVVPLRLSNALGNAGPGLLPLVTVQHHVYSLSPSVGSLGGGQVLTITGMNFPLDAKDIVVSIDVNVSTANGTVVQPAFCNATAAAALPHAVPGTSTRFTCVTTPVTGLDSLTRYTKGGGRTDTTTQGKEYGAEVSVKTRLSMDGDKLRLVSQGEWLNFEDNQRPGIYMATKDSGVEGFVPGGNFLGRSWDIRMVIFCSFIHERQGMS